jgi:hypothetical protein
VRRVTIRLFIVAVVTALSVLGSGCNLQWSPYAAKIGTKVITPAQLDTALSEASTNKGFSCLLKVTPGGPSRLVGAGTDTYDSEFAAYVLTNLIVGEVAHSVVKSDHLAETAFARSMARNLVLGTLSQRLVSSKCGIGTPKFLQQLGPALSGSFVQLQLDEDTLAAHAAHVVVTATGISDYETAHPDVTKESCLVGVFVKSEATASTVEKLLEGGASISSVYAKYSIVTGGNVSLGCYTNPQLTSISTAIEKAVAPATPGKTLAPVPYESAYLVMQVTSRSYEPAVAALSQILSSYASAFATAISTGLRHAAVAVNPVYGRWTILAKSKSTSGFGARVQPPSGPSAAFVLNKSAIVGPSDLAAG